MTADPREVWDRANAVQRERWREHVEPHLPERLLEQVTTGPAPEPPD